MKSSITYKTPLTYLLLISIICGFFWRAEVEYYGWDGLKWLNYFHLAIPFSFILLITWVNSQFKASILKKSLFTLTAFIYVSIMLILIINSFYYPYNKLLAFTEQYSLVMYWLAYILTPLVPLGAFLILKMFVVKTNWKKLLYSTVIFLTAIPLSIFILKITNHIGQADFIHAIKSGYIIPFWVFSLGFLLQIKKVPAT